MAKISGILTDGAGQVINDCTIELYAKKTTSKVLTQTQAFKVANNGSYTMNVLPCEYDVSLIINGFPKKRLGTIQVYSDSLDGSLNDYLLNPTEDEITPAILQQVFDARNETNKSASRAAESEKKIKFSENNAVEASKLAKTSADNAQISEANAKNTAISVENLVDNARSSAQSASESATTASNAIASAKSYSDSSKSYADSASSSATASRNSAQQSSNSANAASSSERNAQTSEQNAKKSADDAKNWASTIDNSNFIKKTGEESQSINGSLIVRESIRCARMFNGDMIGDQRLMPFRRDELPFGWYFRNGDNFLLDSPQGQALNGLSANYKRDHNITIKTIDGKQYINVPTAFAPDGRGYFVRAVDGRVRQVGSVEGDAIRNIRGALQDGPGQAFIGHDNVTNGMTDGAISIRLSGDEWLQNGTRHLRWAFFDFDASRVVPTAHENRPVNIGMTPVIYLGV